MALLHVSMAAWALLLRAGQPVGLGGEPVSKTGRGEPGSPVF